MTKPKIELVPFVPEETNQTTIEHECSSCRVHFDQWDELCEPEPNWRDYIHRRIEERKENVRELLREVQRVTAQLGIVPREQLAAQSAHEKTSAAG